ncbi:MAG: hypothetical protein ACO1N1_23390 [Dyadobacter fermentans]
MQPIQKHPSLLPSEDYFFLRRKGMEYIEALGSKLWTDYNIHDPGITILELMCYAITDLGYRTGFDIKDFVAGALANGGHEQGFFPANEILTVNPVTVNDYRKLLIDEPGIKNAWLLCKDCPCEMPLFADCLAGELLYTETTEKVVPKGTYEVLLEFEDSIQFGSLNDGKLFHQFSFVQSDELFTVKLELRFPDWQSIDSQRVIFKNFLDESEDITTVEVLKVIDINFLPVTNATLQKALRNPLFVDIKITFANTETLVLNQVPLTIHGKNSALKAVELNALLAEIEDKTIAGCRSKILIIKHLIQTQTSKLHKHRNLTEDFCRIGEVATEDFAFCADIDLRPDADMEQIEAQILFTIEQYLNPPIRFYSLKELLDAGIPTEEIFNGPAMRHGFIKDAELEASALKREIRTSDIINLLMDIEGITAVRNFLITRYDARGLAVMPSQAWIYPVTAQHQPRLYIERSQFLYFKNELPFQPANDDEVWATLQQLRSAQEQVKLTTQDNDLPIPTGTARAFNDYFPVQYSFPLTYGIGFEGLPENATPLRKAQAKQLKAYLMFFEQLLVNYLAQLHHTEQLFSIRETAQVTTYFSEYIDNQDIANIEDLYFPDYNPANLQSLTESPSLALRRKNTFLDHLMARFGEQFNEYALLMYSVDNQKFGAEKLIRDKIHFLKDYPDISKNRAKAFNYRDDLKVCGLQNVAGLKKRIAHLTGLEALRNYIQIAINKKANGYAAAFTLEDGTAPLLFSEITETPKTRLEADALVRRVIDELIVSITDSARYTLSATAFTLQNQDNVVIAQSSDNLADPAGTRDALITWAAGILHAERFFLVEHILLRPRLYGQTLLPVCLSPDCESCGDEDPYSFRMTFVMPGWLPMFQNLDLRRYAERMIRLETPAHILPKICWIGNEVCRGDEDNAILCQITDALTANLQEPDTDGALQKDICKCAEQILLQYNAAFAERYFQKNFEAITDAEQETLFTATINKDEILCTGLLKDAFYEQVKALVINWFKGRESCFQFNSFEKYWCEWLVANKAWIDSGGITRLADLLELTFTEAFGIVIRKVPKELRHKIQLNACEYITGRMGQLGDLIRGWVKGNPGVLISAGQIETLAGPLFADPETAIAFAPDLPAAVKTAFTQDFKVNAIAFSDQTETLPDRAIRLIKACYTPEAIRLITAHDNFLRVFASLKSIYPPATLHDCEDGNDDNPVRLDQTVLG